MTQQEREISAWMASIRDILSTASNAADRACGLLRVPPLLLPSIIFGSPFWNFVMTLRP